MLDHFEWLVARLVDIVVDCPDVDVYWIASALAEMGLMEQEGEGLSDESISKLASLPFDFIKEFYEKKEGIRINIR